MTEVSKIRAWLRRLLAFGLAVVIWPSTALAESLYAESATDVICLYPQHRYWMRADMCSYLCTIPLKTTDKLSNMCTSGCMIWAFVHAVEWCRQEMLHTHEAGELVKEFAAANNAPWDVLYVIDDCYHKVAHRYGVVALPSAPETEEEMIAFLRKTGAVICNMGGHCAVAIGYTYHDCDADGKAEMMLHMLDSAVWSSAAKQTIYDFESFKQIESTWACEGEYWMPFSTYVTMDRLAMMPIESLEKSE